MALPKTMSINDLRKKNEQTKAAQQKPGTPAPTTGTRQPTSPATDQT